MIRLYYFIALSAILLSSCATTYTPPLINAPLLGEREDAAVNFALGTRGLYVNVAYAYTQNLGLYFDSNMNLFPENIFQQDGWRLDAGSVSLGTGVFGKTHDGLHYEVFGGAGLGGGVKLDGSFDVIQEGNFTQLYIQTDFGVRRPAFSVIGAARLTYIDFYDLWKEGGNHRHTNAMLLQPSVQFRLQDKNLKTQRHTLQIDFALPLKNPVNFRYPSVTVGIGLLFFGNMKKEKQLAAKNKF